MADKRAAIATLGCKVNQLESGSIVEQLIKRGYSIVDFDQQADIYLINTCTVTNRTDFKSRSLIRSALSAKQANPAAKVIVTGCYAQKEAEEITALGEVDLIVDNQSKVDLSAWLDNLDYQFADIMQAKEFIWQDVDGMHERTRAFLKIQDGCNYFCSYCAVPYGRGKPRSMAFPAVIAQAEKLVEHGYKELVITGINIGLYQDEAHQKTLAGVIAALTMISGLEQIRISSLEPELWTDDLLQVISSIDKICPHFHIPLQSGSDDVLGRMRRRYNTQTVAILMDKLLQVNPHAAIGMDVITGFPGETEMEFESTYNFLSALPIAYLHVFGYSKRKGTPAAKMPLQVHGSIMKERTNRLVKLSTAKKQVYMQMLIGSKVPMQGVVETVSEGYATALSDHYIRMYCRSGQENEFVRGIPVELYLDGLLIG